MSSRPDSGRVIPLPLASHHSAGRSSITCKYRCGNACQHEAPNTSGNAYFGDIVESVLSRRGALKATGALALTVGGAAVLNGTAAAAPGPAPARGAVPGTDFAPVAPNTEDAVVIADGYRQGVVIRWGDPVVEGAPEFDFAHPLTVLRGQVVALTIPTWAPMFAFNVEEDNTWRGSRLPEHCSSKEDIQNGHPQQGVGKTKTYGCYYSNARLLYTATLVKAAI